MNWLNRFSDKSPIFIPLALLAITASFCTLPLFVNQSLPLAQDIVFHIFQADQFSKALNDGILYPRWISDANNGYGSPTFIFYAPLSYYFVSVINFLIPSLITSMIIVIWCGFFLSGVAMYLAASRMFGGHGSLLSAILYQIFPYHIFNLYIRGAFAELLAFIWFPLIILFIHKIFYTTDNKPAFAGLSISYAGLILTHLVSGFIFSIDHIINFFAGDYKKNFLFTSDKFQPEFLNFYLPLHAGVVVVSVLFLFVAIKNLPTIHKQKHFFIFSFLTAFFLTIQLSRPIWDAIPEFKNLQFPWRWAPVMELSLCFLISGVFSRGNYKKDVIMRLIVYLMITISVLSFITVFKSKPLPDKFMNKIADPIQFQLIMDPVIEYIPVWATSLEEILAEKERDRVSVISGAAMSQIIEWRSEKRAISVKASEPSLLRIATFYFPGWEAEIDGKKTEIHIEKDTGAMLIDIPKGEHLLKLKFEDTPVRHYSKIIWVLSILLLIIFVFYEKLRQKRYHILCFRQ